MSTARERAAERPAGPFGLFAAALLLGAAWTAAFAGRAAALGIDALDSAQLPRDLAAGAGAVVAAIGLRRFRRLVVWLGLGLSLLIAAGAGMAVLGLLPAGHERLPPVLVAGDLFALALVWPRLRGLRHRAWSAAWLALAGAGIGAGVLQGVFGAVPSAGALAVLALLPLVTLAAGPLLRRGPHVPQPWWFGWFLAAALAVGSPFQAPAIQSPLGAACAAAAIAVGIAAAGSRRWLPFWLAFTLGAAAPLLRPACRVDPLRKTLLATTGGGAAVYDRATQAMELWCDGSLVAADGPMCPLAPFTAAVVAAFAAPSDRVLVLGEGTGRLPPALGTAGLAAVDVVAFRRSVRPLLPVLAQDGPVPLPSPRRPVSAARVRGLAAALAALPTGSRQAILVAEPLHAGAADAVTVERQVELRRVAGAGLVVQPLLLERAPADLLHELCEAVVAVHPWTGVFAIGDLVLLVSAGAPLPLPPRREPASADHRWLLHAAHLGGADDVARALVGVLTTADRRQDARSVLGAHLAPLVVPPAVADGPSQLVFWRERESRRLAVERALCELGGDPAAAAGVRAQVATFLPMGAPSAVLQAALALPDAAGVRFGDPEAAALAAFAIDPTIFQTPSPVFAALPRPRRDRGDLEDFAMLPSAARLAELGSGTRACAVALRARFPSATARALVDRLAAAPLEGDQRQALRELADPFVLAEAGRVLALRSALPELLAYWRGDLPMPSALLGLRRAEPGVRQLLATALAGRRGSGAVGLLADLLLDEDRGVRRAAAAALPTLGGAVEYDPDWTRSRRFVAAEKVRALHNRAP